MNDLLLTYYGDDFSGSTDVMEALTLGGIPTALFLEPPSPEQLVGPFSHLKALGVAGVSRSMAPAAMEKELRPTFGSLKSLGAPITHYKVCSTFDSSPEIGSIGLATDIGAEVFASKYVPMVVGAPVLKRYVVFGNLFARVDETTYRIDRHPTMSCHPVTPMTEGDLRRHLGKQTHKPVATLDVWHLAQPAPEQADRFARLLDEGAEIVLFDTLDEAHLPLIGRYLWEYRGDRPLFVVGSSGVEYALAAYWQQIGMARPRPAPSSAGRRDLMIVMAGSASPATSAQIDRAVEQGYVALRLDTLAIIDETTADAHLADMIERALAVLAGERSVILYTAKGPSDPAIEATRRAALQVGLPASDVGPTLARWQGRLLRKLIERTPVRRACVAGGDTSGYIARALDIFALEMVIPIAPGSPLCRVFSADARIDGLEIAFKGGQVGSADYFLFIQNGEA